MSRHEKKTKKFSTRGYFGIGILEPTNEVNVGGLWRSAMLMGASFVFTIAKEYRYMRSDTQKTYRHLPLFHFQGFDRFLCSMPYDSKLIAVEQHSDSIELTRYVHPERTVYLLGTEETGLPREVIEHAYQVLEIPTLYELSLNVHVAGSIVMYDRFNKAGLRPLRPHPSEPPKLA